MERVSLLSKLGMSLVEPLVAMVVLSFSLLGSVSMFALAQDGIAVGARKLQAIGCTCDVGDGAVERNLLDGVNWVGGHVDRTAVGRAR